MARATIIRRLLVAIALIGVIVAIARTRGGADNSRTALESRRGPTGPQLEPDHVDPNVPVSERPPGALRRLLVLDQESGHGIQGASVKASADGIQFESSTDSEGICAGEFPTADEFRVLVARPGYLDANAVVRPRGETAVVLRRGARLLLECANADAPSWNGVKLRVSYGSFAARSLEPARLVDVGTLPEGVARVAYDYGDGEIRPAITVALSSRSEARVRVEAPVERNVTVEVRSGTRSGPRLAIERLEGSRDGLRWYGLEVGGARTALPAATRFVRVRCHGHAVGISAIDPADDAIVVVLRASVSMRLTISYPPGEAEAGPLSVRVLAAQSATPGQATMVSNAKVYDSGTESSGVSSQFRAARVRGPVLARVAVEAGARSTQLRRLPASTNLVLSISNGVGIVLLKRVRTVAAGESLVDVAWPRLKSVVVRVGRPDLAVRIEASEPGRPSVVLGRLTSGRDGEAVLHGVSASGPLEVVVSRGLVSQSIHVTGASLRSSSDRVVVSLSDPLAPTRQVQVRVVSPRGPVALATVVFLVDGGASIVEETNSAGVAEAQIPLKRRIGVIVTPPGARGGQLQWIPEGTNQFVHRLDAQNAFRITLRAVSRSPGYRRMSVRILRAGRPVEGAIALVGKHGTFVFDQLPPAEYAIECTEPPGVATQTIELREDRVLRLELE